MAVDAPVREKTATLIGTGVRGWGNTRLPEPPTPVRTTVTVIVTDFYWKPNEGETAEIEVGTRGMSLEVLNQMLTDKPELVGRTNVDVGWPVKVDGEVIPADQHAQTIVMPGQTVVKKDP